MRDTLNVVKMRWWVAKEVGSMGRSNGEMRLSGTRARPIALLYLRLCIELKCDTAGCRTTVDGVISVQIPKKDKATGISGRTEYNAH